MNDIEELIRFYKTFQLLFCFHGEGGHHVEKIHHQNKIYQGGTKFQKGGQ